MVVNKEVRMNEELFNTIPEELKVDIYTLIGKAYVTKKRVAIPKVIYNQLNKDQKKALRACLDCAAE